MKNLAPDMSVPAFESKLTPSDDTAALAARLAALPRPLVFTNGVFDILHRGHATYLAQARELGASLVVGVNSDASVRMLGKGDDRPLNHESDRMALLAALYFLWQPLTLPFGNTTTSSDESDLATSDAVNGDLSDSQSSAQTTATTASSSATATTASTSGTSDTAKIQVYIVGAVYHPGLYSLDASARLYQLVQAAGGPLPDADMTALNMAAQLTDGQEIYVLRVNETPPATIGSDSTIAMGGSARGSSSSSASSKTATATSHAAATSTALANQGPKININTATSTELQQGLGIGSQTANEIITYRVQHGSYKTVADLANAVSSSMYSKLKNKVMV